MDKKLQLLDCKERLLCCDKALRAPGQSASKKRSGYIDEGALFRDILGPLDIWRLKHWVLSKRREYITQQHRVISHKKGIVSHKAVQN
jgi:hypothetical protein